MDEIRFFSVTVKLEEETDMVDKVGNPKIKKWSEDYLVRATTSQEANEIVKKEMDGVTADWRISKITETKYLAVLDVNGEVNCQI
jgi:hypothetical protein